MSQEENSAEVSMSKKRKLSAGAEEMKTVTGDSAQSMQNFKSELSSETLKGSDTPSTSIDNIKDLAITEETTDAGPANDQRPSTSRHGKSKPEQNNPVVEPLMKDKIIHIFDNGRLLMTLKKQLTLCGKFHVGAVRGTLEISGFEIQPSPERYPVFSPNCNALQTIRVRDTKKTCVEDMDEEIRRKVLDVPEEFAVIEISELHCQKCDFVVKSDIPVKKVTIFDSNGYEIGLHGVKVVSDAGNSVLEPEDHMAAAEMICDTIAKGTVPIIMMCGGKNLGKSTFSRYLVNKILSRASSKIAFFETDIGQTEFTPSNFVSLSILKRPILGPPFTHEIWPKFSAFFGDNTPSRDPRFYLKCVKQVLDKYLSMQVRVPLIINTMGWHKDLGLALFMDILRLSRASHIIQISHADNKRNFPVMSPRDCNKLNGFETRASDSDPLDYDLIQVNSVLNLTNEGNSRVSPRDHRNFSLFHYFGSNPCLLETVPYEVPWSKLAVSIIRDEPVPGQILCYLNACIVALCTIPKQKLPRPNPNAPTVLTDTSLLPADCVGLGIIRGIDPERKVFYIISPVPLREIKQVNCIVKGALEIPSQFIESQKIMQSIPGTIPYLGASRDATGVYAVSRQRHMMRGKPQSQSRKQKDV